MTVHYCKPRRLKGYTNAFNGLGEVTGLKSGDTLVLSGLHDAGRFDNNLILDVPGVTVIGDPNDPFKLVACHLKLTNPAIWKGPNKFGVFSTDYSGSTSRLFMQGTKLLKHMSKPPCDKWKDGCFYQAGSGTTLYVRPYGGSMEDVFYTSTSNGIRVHAPDIQLKNLEAMLSTLPFEFYGADRCIAEGLKSIYGSHGFQIVNTQNARFFDLEARHCAVGGYLNSGGGNSKISSGCVFSWVKVIDNDQEGYFSGGDNHGWGVQGGNHNLFEAFEIDGCAGSGFTNYQFRGQQMCYNTFRDIDIKNIINLEPGRQQNERGFELGGDRGIEAELHIGNRAYNVSIENARLGVRMKSLYSAQGPVWDCENFHIKNCNVGLHITEGSIAGLNFTNSEFENCKTNILKPEKTLQPHVDLSGNKIY